MLTAIATVARWEGVSKDIRAPLVIAQPVIKKNVKSESPKLNMNF